MITRFCDIHTHIHTDGRTGGIYRLAFCDIHTHIHTDGRTGGIYRVALLTKQV